MKHRPANKLIFALIMASSVGIANFGYAQTQQPQGKKETVKQAEPLSHQASSEQTVTQHIHTLVSDLNIRVGQGLITRLEQKISTSIRFNLDIL